MVLEWLGLGLDGQDDISYYLHGYDLLRRLISTIKEEQVPWFIKCRLSPRFH